MSSSTFAHFIHCFKSKNDWFKSLTFNFGTGNSANNLPKAESACVFLIAPTKPVALPKSPATKPPNALDTEPRINNELGSNLLNFTCSSIAGISKSVTSCLDFAFFNPLCNAASP